jgi:hypothetical protein
MGMHVTDLSSTATETMGFVLWDNEIQSNILLGNGKRIPLQDPLYIFSSQLYMIDDLIKVDGYTDQ